MTIYDLAAIERLKEKVDYELWLLDFLSKKQDILEGGAKVTEITLRNRKPGPNVHIAISEVLGSGAALKIINAMRPLTFVASYKILDMIFEWILEENFRAWKIGEIPWRFSDKIRMLSVSRLDVPTLFQAVPYIEKYLFALYSNLLKFRNEIVHKHNFLIQGNILRIEASERGQNYTLELDPGELGAYVRIAIAGANLLTGDLAFGSQVDRLLKYHLDRLCKIHGLAGFKQEMPIPINVILEVPEENNVFPADLDFLRKELRRIHPSVDISFNLKVIGLVDEKPIVAWFFPYDSLPKNDLIELRPDSPDSYRISLGKEE
jgi:hypothetical protein